VLEAQLARPRDTGTLESAFRIPVDTREDPDLDALSAKIRNARS
jgi:hypothetical protein